MVIRVAIAAILACAPAGLAFRLVAAYCAARGRPARPPAPRAPAFRVVGWGTKWRKRFDGERPPDSGGIELSHTARRGRPHAITAMAPRGGDRESRISQGPRRSGLSRNVPEEKLNRPRFIDEDDGYEGPERPCARLFENASQELASRRASAQCHACQDHGISDLIEKWVVLGPMAKLALPSESGNGRQVCLSESAFRQLAHAFVRCSADHVPKKRIGPVYIQLAGASVFFAAFYNYFQVASPKSCPSVCVKMI